MFACFAGTTLRADMASLARDNPLRRAARKIQAVSAFQDALRRRVAGHAGAEAAPPPALELNATTSASAPIRTSTTAEAVVGTYDEVFDFFADLPIRTTAPDDLPRVARGDLPSKRDNVCRAMVERGYIVVSLSDEDAELVAKARAMEDVGFSFQRLLYRPGIHPCIHTHVHTCTCTLGPKLSLNPQAMEKTSAATCSSLTRAPCVAPILAPSFAPSRLFAGFLRLVGGRQENSGAAGRPHGVVRRR